jgi:hypothetical protein
VQSNRDRFLRGRQSFGGPITFGAVLGGDQRFGEFAQ